MKKGMELPINMLVVVAVAVIVLMGVIAIYIMGVGPFSQNVGLEAIKSNACAIMLRNGCEMSSSDIIISTDANQDGIICAPGYTGYTDKDSNGNDLETPVCWIDNADGDSEDWPTDTLQDLCKNTYGKPTDNECKQVCNCPGYY